MSESSFSTRKGPVTEKAIHEALREHGVTTTDEIVREAVAHVQREIGAGKEVGFWIAYNNGKWGLCGPDT